VSTDPLPGSLVTSHVTAHHARKLARDGKPETGAAEALRGRGIGLREFLKRPPRLLRGHADAAIGRGELDPAIRLTLAANTRFFTELKRELKG